MGVRLLHSAIGLASAHGARVLTLALLMLVSASPAAGFTCVPRDARAAAAEATAVVEGVIEAESIFGIRLGVERTYERTYTATVARTITLPGQANANRVGQPWTFYVQRNPIAYGYTDCGGSHRGLLTPEERAAFGAGLEPRPDEQGLGQTGNLVALGAVLAALVVIARRRRPRQPPLTPAGAHP